MTDAAMTASPTARASDGPGPLAGVRVIELGMLLAGPFAGRLLGDMGAEVIKLEPPGQPDPLREWGKARYEGRSLWWPVQSRNKKCVTLNLREERGQELLGEHPLGIPVRPLLDHRAQHRRRQPAEVRELIKETLQGSIAAGCLDGLL